MVGLDPARTALANTQKCSSVFQCLPSRLDIKESLDSTITQYYLVIMNPRKGQRLKPRRQIKERILTIRLTQEQYKRLLKLAEEDERSVSFLIRKAVEGYLSSKR